MEDHSGGCCKCHSSSSYDQTMSEMDFTRGVWTAAMDGELQKVEAYLDKRGDPNAVDTSGYTALVSRQHGQQFCPNYVVIFSMFNLSFWMEKHFLWSKPQIFEFKTLPEKCDEIDYKFSIYLVKNNLGKDNLPYLELHSNGMDFLIFIIPIFK